MSGWSTSVPALIKYLRRERPHAVISGAIQTNIMAVFAHAAARVHSRLVLTEHNYMALMARNADTLRGRLSPDFIGWAYPRADSIVAVSYAVADEMARACGLHRQSIRVIYNPVLLPDFEALSLQPLQHPWFAAGEPPVILAVGRLTRAKDYPVLLRAFAALRRHTRARLLILGEGEARTSLEALITKLECRSEIALPGNVDNPYPYMRAAALFVLSSLFEGLPTVLVEALALKAPIVATDCASGPAEILGTREGLVPVGDMIALAKAMEGALENGGVDYAANARLERFRLSTAVDAYLDVVGLNDYAGPSSSR
jgi:glycosyltransferase involved in cell wall biosynthesis